ncbi:HlyD family type I secretion periplasmic adaptor subunit [Aureimonas sp. AU12]|uniref:HlyD family type I secretion periplasmic adaptor subunit n=1 Tax=Aureimonas sp. AU12 TaxID=1638161 RepID=UPI000782B049|nr:HlyD family type I secretion periplasmic adaptor subunit [Aureimonas sp. AU12]
MSSTTLTPINASTAVGMPATVVRKGPRRHWADTVQTSSSKITLIGMIASLAFVGGFGIWAGTVPLAGASISHGYVAASGRNLQIQHLEGGIIRAIHVKEGDAVKAGQTLFDFDPTAATALRNRLSNQLFALQSRAARLEAERDGNGALAFSASLLSRAEDPVFASILEEQRKEFTTKLEGHRRELAILGQQIASLNEQITGTSDQKAAAENQIAVVTDELGRRKSLLDKGLANRRDYTDFLLSQSQLTGQIGQLSAGILSSRTQIAEKAEQVARLESRRVEEAAAELNDVRTKISDIDEQLAAAQEVLARSEVRAPSDGVVVKLNYNAPGSVVSSGQSLAEILPTSESLIVETRLTPQDIDSVHMNQAAELRFTALNRLTPTVDATVTYVSPDRLMDQRTDQPYYLARLRITDALPASIDRAQIYPGMPVETYIRTGDRTFFEYLLKPLEDSFSRAFREK